MIDLKKRFYNTRKYTESICVPLVLEDYVVQPVEEVSPPKWHLGHTSWFLETFILKKFKKDYKVFNEDYDFLFNSYYESVGDRVSRNQRGNLSRPTVESVYKYRNYIDQEMGEFFMHNHEMQEEILYLIDLGIQHEQQHQELLMTDIKYILGHNPLYPVYDNYPEDWKEHEDGLLVLNGGKYQVGYKDDDFCFDNELEPHEVNLEGFEISKRLVSNGEYTEFIESGGYSDFRYWHSEGWSWVQQYGIQCPMYWHKMDKHWYHYTLQGMQRIQPEDSLKHISFYEASAYADWKGMRLPSEFEWEAAADHFRWGERWEWTNSAYLPYPGYHKASGAIGEYNGKFMVNQIVLRGSSIVTPADHSRKTYRNFLHPQFRWQYTGIRLAR